MAAKEYQGTDGMWGVDWAHRDRQMEHRSKNQACRDVLLPAKCKPSPEEETTNQ
jgi:hypothetical protein